MLNNHYYLQMFYDTHTNVNKSFLSTPADVKYLELIYDWLKIRLSKRGDPAKYRTTLSNISRQVRAGTFRMRGSYFFDAVSNVVWNLSYEGQNPIHSGLSSNIETYYIRVALFLLHKENWFVRGRDYSNEYFDFSYTRALEFAQQEGYVASGWITNPLLVNQLDIIYPVIVHWLQRPFNVARYYEIMAKINRLALYEYEERYFNKLALRDNLKHYAADIYSRLGSDTFFKYMNLTAVNGTAMTSSHGTLLIQQVLILLYLQEYMNLRKPRTPYRFLTSEAGKSVKA